MSHPSTRLYTDYPDDLHPLLEEKLESALASRSTAGPVPLFFRADDIGVPSRNFTRLIEIFRIHGVPLNLAVVPTWLTHTRWSALESLCRPDPGLWSWHQHGFSHKNHEPSGKKCEFGPDRTAREIRRDIANGRDRLSAILGDCFSPYFTPPWNRCSQATLIELHHLGFKAVSRNRESKPDSLSLPDLHVNVDLHTRKEPDSKTSLAALLLEIEDAVQSGRIGIMIHHQRMNDPSFAFLDDLLDIIVRCPQLEPTTLSNLV